MWYATCTLTSACLTLGSSTQVAAHNRQHLTTWPNKQNLCLRCLEPTWEYFIVFRRKQEHQEKHQQRQQHQHIHQVLPSHGLASRPRSGRQRPGQIWRATSKQTADSAPGTVPRRLKKRASKSSGQNSRARLHDFLDVKNIIFRVKKWYCQDLCLKSVLLNSTCCLP